MNVEKEKPRLGQEARLERSSRYGHLDITNDEPSKIDRQDCLARSLLLALMRASRVGFQIRATEIEEVENALGSDFIAPAGAIYWLYQNGIADFVLPPVTDTGRATA